MQLGLDYPSSLRPAVVAVIRPRHRKRSSAAARSHAGNHERHSNARRPTLCAISVRSAKGVYRRSLASDCSPKSQHPLHNHTQWLKPECTCVRLSRPGCTAHTSAIDVDGHVAHPFGLVECWLNALDAMMRLCKRGSVRAFLSHALSGSCERHSRDASL